MSTTPNIDYDALAKQAESGTAAAPAAPDYDALARQAEKGTATPPPSQMDLAAQQQKEGLIGMGKSVVATGAGLTSLINRANFLHPGDPLVPQLADVTRRALEWSQPKTEAERAGFITGNVGQLVLPGGIFEDAMAALPYADKVAEAAKALKTIGSDSIVGRLSRIGASVLSDAVKTAPRAAAEVGGQTYLQTQDPEQARQAAISAAKWGGALGAAGGAVGGVRREAAAVAQSLRPGTRMLAGVPFETVPRTEDLMLRNLKQVPGGDPASQAVDLAMGNVGRTAVKNSVDALNAARAPEAVVIPPTRQLPGATGGIAVGPAAEPEIINTEGQLLQPARKRQMGTKVVEGKGPGQFNLQQYETGQAPPPTGEGELTQRGSHREPIWQYQTAVRPGSPEAQTQIVTGPGQLIFTDSGEGLPVARARQQLERYDRILSDPAQTDEMGPRQLQDLQNEHADLTEQLRRHDDFAASQPNFPVHDVLSAMQNTNSLNDAGAQLKGIGGQLWNRADQLARDAGDTESFSGLRAEAKSINKRMYNGSASYDDLRQELADNQRRMANFFDRYRTQLNPQEASNYIRTYQDGAVVDSLGSLIQGQFRRGITQAEAARGVGQRVFQPSEEFGKQLENFYSDNRDVLQRTIGQDHMDDLKTMTSELFQNAQRREATQGLVKSIGSAIRRHSIGLRAVLGGVAGGGATGAYLEYMGSHLTGHALAGTVAGGAIGAGTLAATLGGAVSGTQRYIVDNLATNPDFMRRFVYAVQNEVPPRVAGPLLAARILGQNTQVARPATAAAPAAAPAAPAEAAAPAAPLRARRPPDSISFTYRGAQWYRDSSGNFYDSAGSPLGPTTQDEQSAMDRAANQQTGGR